MRFIAVDGRVACALPSELLALIKLLTWHFQRRQVSRQVISLTAAGSRRAFPRSKLGRLFSPRHSQRPRSVFPRWLRVFRRRPRQPQAQPPNRMPGSLPAAPRRPPSPLFTFANTGSMECINSRIWKSSRLSIHISDRSGRARMSKKRARRWRSFTNRRVTTASPWLCRPSGRNRV